MRDLREYANDGKKRRNETRAENNKVGGESLADTVQRLTAEFNGKGKTELLRAIYAEAERGKRAGTLTNAEIDGFVQALSPALDGKSRAYLKKVAEELKKI